MLRDPDLLEFLESVDIRPWSGRVFRAAWAERDPTHGSSTKTGRWSSPRRDFEVLYTSMERAGADAEFEAFWSLFEQRPDKAVLTHELSVRLDKAIHLDFPALAKLGISEASYQDRDYVRTQEIADAINFLEYDALISPSARYTCKNVTIFFQNLSRDFELEKVGTFEFQWST